MFPPIPHKQELQPETTSRQGRQGLGCNWRGSAASHAHPGGTAISQGGQLRPVQCLDRGSSCSRPWGAWEPFQITAVTPLPRRGDTAVASALVTGLKGRNLLWWL